MVLNHLWIGASVMAAAPSVTSTTLLSAHQTDVISVGGARSSRVKKNIQIEQMNFTITFFVALLFVVLSPGVLLSLPSRGSLLTKVLVHALVFAVVFYLTASTAWQWSVSVEGFRPPPLSFAMVKDTTPPPMDGSDRITLPGTKSSTGVKKSGPALDMYGYQV
jgi:NADH:ubiquinone oxidoreductase subunit 3 (subunit A)